MVLSLLEQLDFAKELEQHFHAPESGDSKYDEDRLVPSALSLALSRPQVMATTRERLVETICSLLERGVGLLLEYNEGHPDFPLPAVSNETTKKTNPERYLGGCGSTKHQ